jgi:hypothetical protein
MKNQYFTDLLMHDYDYQSSINRIEDFYRSIVITRGEEQHSLMQRIIDLNGIKDALVNLFMKKEKIYEAMLRYVGTDASPADKAPDELGCAESISMVIRSVIPDFPIVLHTKVLKEVLDKRPEFEKYHPEVGKTPFPAGTIILCATEPGHPFPGHVGGFGLNNTIFSNDSRKEFLGKFLMNYTLQKWIDRWVTKGGYVLHFYRLKK